MEEQANQAQLTEEAIMPDETAIPEAEGTEQPELTTTEPEPTQEPHKLKVKYNHQDIELGEDEAVPLIQKGMNYDKLQEKYNAIQSDPRLSKADKVKQVSELLGYQSDDELLEALYQTYYQSAAEQQGLTPEQIRRDHELKQRENALNQKEQTLTQKHQTEAMYERFLSAFPNAKPEDIKPETWQKVQSGMDLTTAYVMQKNQDLADRLKRLEQNQKNKNIAPVSGVTAHGSQDPAGEDDFLAGFNSDD